jgi:methionyl-tRNA synthetase
LYTALEAVRISALFTAPVMPTTSAEVWRRLGLPDILQVNDLAAVADWGRLPVGNAVDKGDPLFPRILDEPSG